MLSKIFSAATYGINAYFVEVETHIQPNTTPNFLLVGLPDNAVKESRERVSSAIRNSGLHYPGLKITVNLAPADVKKEGSSYDLPIAIGILAANANVSEEKLSDYIILGELALDGSLRPIHGVLPIALEVKHNNKRGIILPKENANEAAMVQGIEVFGVSSLNEALEFLNGSSSMQPTTVNIKDVFEN
ncbi:MAG: ATP-binding protein, partial [Ignavibacteria bacterium]|nr:ATP-binding protein [Ignavibacteria bacterium]